MATATGDTSGGINDVVLIKKFSVKNGTCSTCDGKVQSSSIITCKLCDVNFHAVCPVSTKQDRICNETLLRNYSQNSTRENFLWYCNACYTMNEHDTKCSLMEKLNALLFKFDLLKSSFDKVKNEVANNTMHIKNMVENNIHTTEAPNQTSDNQRNDSLQQPNAWLRPLAADKSKQSNRTKRTPPKKKKVDTSLILKCNEDGEQPDISQIKDVAVSYGIPINQVSLTNNNNAVISLPSIEARDTLKPLLAARPSLKKHEVSNIEVKLPIITVLDIEENLDENEFMNMMKLQNAGIATLIEAGEELSNIVLKNRKAGNKTFTQVNITVSANIRKEIENRGNRLFIGLKSCRVVDKVNITRCYICHTHGHLARNCSKIPCCGYCCSNNHASRDCVLKDDIYGNKNSLNCINCHRHKLNPIGHSVFWSLCPINKQFRENAKRSTAHASDSDTTLNG